MQTSSRLTVFQYLFVLFHQRPPVAGHIQLDAIRC